MTTTYYVDGTAGSDSTGDGSQGNPYKTINKCAAANGTFADSMVLYLAAGSTIVADTSITGSPNSAFRTPVDADLTIRAYGGGAKPIISVPASNGQGFKTQGNGSIDAQDVWLVAAAATTGVGFQSRTGGGCILRRVDITKFFNSMKIGSGTVLVEDCGVYQPGNCGLYIDVDAATAVGSNGIIRRCYGQSGNPTANDLLVLHDGGIGIASGWIVEDNHIEAVAGGGMESGIDIQQQFRGAIVRRNRVSGAKQWAIAEGSFYKSSSSALNTFPTKEAMLAAFTRETVGTGPNKIDGGCCAWVSADGGNNGLYQLTGSDPQLSASWTGPMTASDFLADRHSLYYGNVLLGCVGGIQVQHPGSQFVANIVEDVTLGDWLITTTGLYGAGALVKLESMGYGAQIWGNVIATSSGKYLSVQTGALTTCTRAAVYVSALHAQVSARTRATLKDNAIRQRTEHVGPFVSFASTTDHGYLDSDYNAWIADGGVSDGTWPNFSSSAGALRTYTNYKAINGGSDAHSLWQTPTTAIIDDDCRPGDSSTLIGAGTARAGLDGAIPSVDAEGRAIASPPDIGGYAYVSDAVQATIAGTPRRTLRAVRTPGTPPSSGAAPDTPTGLGKDSATSTTLTMSWTVVDNATNYDLRYAISGQPWTTDTGVGDPPYTIGSLSGASTYDVQVRAGNGGGVSDWSASVAAATA